VVPDEHNPLVQLQANLVVEKNLPSDLKLPFREAVFWKVASGLSCMM